MKTEELIFQNSDIISLKMIIFEETGVMSEAMKSKSRRKQLVTARMLFAYHAKRFGFTSMEIGEEINISHATVLYLCKEYMNRVQFDKSFALLARRVEKRFNDYYNEEVA